MELTTRQKNALKSKNIDSLLQLHRWVPLRYIDNSLETGLSEALDKKHAVVIGTLNSAVKKEMSGGSRHFMQIKVTDRISKKNLSVLVFSESPYIERMFSSWIGTNVIVSGQLQHHPTYGYSICGPDTFSQDIEENMKVKPVFSKIKGMSEDTFKTILTKSLDDKETETVNYEVRSAFNIMDINAAIGSINFPGSIKEAKSAANRFIFDDLYYLAGRFELSNRDSNMIGIEAKKSDITESVINSLPYKLTNGQKNTYESIKEKMMNGQRIKALVQGDVGCGKTITAFLSMLLTAENGYQAVIMAPTKILALQHYEKLSGIIKNTGLSAVLVTSETTDKETIRKISSGEVKLIVGTHSMLSDKIVFNNLGLLVIDEEHKFGVSQRQKIEEKESNINSISMSATPIPRSLAIALYGNSMNVYSIKDMPAGRKKVITKYDSGENIRSIVMDILKAGQQVYAVCPMINKAEEDSLMDGVLSTEEAAKEYKKMFPEYVVKELNGTNTPEETDSILSDFRENKINILVSTTVVEVGVDVPNATMMVIHNAERFGLAGMHQLRGRVGRGDKQSYCILVSKDLPEENERISTLLNTTDGFEIAERDLEFLRKSGDVFGDEQSGRNRYIDEMIMYPGFYKRIRETVRNVSSIELKNHADKMLLAEIRNHRNIPCFE